ncbi:MAG: bactofilin family protein [Limnochordia bacterium]|jgi:hypothetical protein
MLRRSLILLFLILLLAVPAGAAIEHRQGDLIRFGASVHIPQDLVVDGSVVVIGGSARVEGSVLGDVVVIGGSNMIDGPVAGDVVAVGGRVVLLSGARVDGDVTGIGGGIRLYPEARVRGKMNDVGIGGLDLNFRRFHFAWPLWTGPFQVLPLLATIALALIVTALFPKAMHNISYALEVQPGRCALLGFLGLAAVMPATILLILTIIGIPLVFLLISGLFLAWVIGYLAIALFIGSRITGEAQVAPMAQILIGIILLNLLRYVPILGWFGGILIGIFGIGAMLNSRFGTQRVAPFH